jgi:hypothetical protein
MKHIIYKVLIIMNIRREMPMRNSKKICRQD